MEHQQTEWKESWRDEYLKWICGFANAQGGFLEIGRNDKGQIVGLDNPKRWLEVIPNRIKQAMGIICPIHLLEESGKPYIRIQVDPSPSPISYHGRYYKRSGATNQELTGSVLDDFILRAQGKTWDSLPVPDVQVSDLDIAAIRAFRKKAIDSERLKAEDLEINDAQLMESLMLTDKGSLKRAAVLLFHENPEQWFFGAHIKIAYFENDAEIRYQDEIHGPLILMADKVMDALYLKYFKGLISYDDIQRVERYPVPRAAMREALLNSICHRDYRSGVPIQIRVYDDKVVIYNDGGLPENWTAEDLLSDHRSIPRNPMIANTFFRSGMIETWGRGIRKITEACRYFGKPDPVFKVKPNELKVTFYSDASITANITLNETQRRILTSMAQNPRITVKALAEEVGIAERNVKSNISVLKNAGLVERVGAAKNGHWAVKTGN